MLANGQVTTVATVYKEQQNFCCDKYVQHVESPQGFSGIY